MRKLLEKHTKEQARLEQLIAMVTLKKNELDEKIAKQTSIYTVCETGANYRAYYNFPYFIGIRWQGNSS